MPGAYEYRWNHITSDWEKAPAVVTVDRRIGTGLIAGGAHKLYWVACNPGAGNSLWEITDAVAPGGAVLLDCFSTAKESKGFVFNPPCPFTNGIYLETFTNMTAMTFGYI